MFYTSVSPTLSSYQVLDFVLGALLPALGCVDCKRQYLLLCCSAADGAGDLQRRGPDRRRLLGQIQDRPPAGEKTPHAAP